MGIQVVSGVSLVPQDKNNACWYFSARMVSQWSQANGGHVKDPSSDDQLEKLYKGDFGYAPSTAKDLAKTLGMKTIAKQDRTQVEYQTLLQKGPLWCQGLKGGANGFPHVVVICGVSDTGVLIHDPLPLKQGERVWKTWAWLKNFMQTSDPSMDYNLLTP